jgi:hypothetical protein
MLITSIGCKKKKPVWNLAVQPKSETRTKKIPTKPIICNPSTDLPFPTILLLPFPDHHTLLEIDLKTLSLINSGKTANSPVMNENAE